MTKKMFVIGIAHLSQHKTVEAIPEGYEVHYFLLREKARKHAKKTEPKEVPAPPKDLKVKPIDLAPAGTPDPVGLLRDFCELKTKKRKLLLVEGMVAMFSIRKFVKKHRKKIDGLVIFDNPSNLFDYKVPVVDADRVNAGIWQKRAGFAKDDLPRVLEQNQGQKFDLKQLARIRRELISDPESSRTEKAVAKEKEGQAKGFLRGVLKKLDRLLKKSKKREKLLTSVMGAFVGVTKRSELKSTFALLGDKYELDKKMQKEIEQYRKSRKGRHLASVFYLVVAKGEKFNLLQTKYRHLDMDDWMALSKYVPSTSKYRFHEKPKKV